MISSFVWMTVFLSGPSQVPTVDAIRDAAAANRDHIESFVLKAHAIETERGEIPPDQDDSIINGTAEPFASLAPYATTRPALAQYQERRYQEARVIGQQNAIAVRERSPARTSSRAKPQRWRSSVSVSNFGLRQRRTSWPCPASVSASAACIDGQKSSARKPDRRISRQRVCMAGDRVIDGIGRSFSSAAVLPSNCVAATARPKTKH